MKLKDGNHPNYNLIRTCVTKVSNWEFQPKGQTLKGKIKNHIPIIDFGLEDKSIAN
jgi:hypothetical protein